MRQRQWHAAAPVMPGQDFGARFLRTLSRTNGPIAAQHKDPALLLHTANSAKPCA